MDRILIATDLSARSAHALKRGFMIGSSCGALVRVVSVVDDAIPEPLVAGLVADMTKELQRETAALASDEPCNYEVEVSSGDVSEEIVKQATRFEADLIVLGLHRDRAVIDSFRETTMERIARLSHNPVLLVRNAVEGDYRNVLCTIDFSPAAAAAVAAAKQIAGSADYKLFHAYHVVHHMRADFPVNVDLFMRQAEAECKNWAAANPELAALGKVELIDGPLESVFERQVERHGPDLVALGAHSRPALSRFLFGSFAKDLIRDPPTDILISQP